jgi:hypothetical protein
LFSLLETIFDNSDLCLCAFFDMDSVMKVRFFTMKLQVVIDDGVDTDRKRFI